jgi:hypothetical protein
MTPFLGRVVQILFGGAVVYGAMAACSSHGGSGSSVAKADPSTSGPADGSRLKMRYLTGDDGSRTALGLFDTKLNVPCAFTHAEDGQYRCLPTDAPEARGGWSDAQCAVPALFASGNTNCAPAYILERSAPDGFTCAANVTIVHRAGATVKSFGTAQSSSGGRTSCLSTTSVGANAPAGSTFYVAGDKVSPDEFVAGTEQ